MRIAVSGSHGTGKSTLVSALARKLPAYESVDEPYHSMLDEGYVFAAVPSFREFEQLLDRSLTELTEPLPHDVLFDRCPVDYLAYLANLTRPKDHLLRRWIPEVGEAISRLELVVYVPIERPDRIPVHREEGRNLRRRVDETIREMLVEDGWGFGVTFLEVHGDFEDRVHQVDAHIGGGR